MVWAWGLDHGREPFGNQVEGEGEDLPTEVVEEPKLPCGASASRLPFARGRPALLVRGPGMEGRRGRGPLRWLAGCLQ